MKYFLFLLIFFPLTNSFAVGKERRETYTHYVQGTGDGCRELPNIARKKIAGYCNFAFGGVAYGPVSASPLQIKPLSKLPGKPQEFKCEEAFIYRCNRD